MNEIQKMAEAFMEEPPLVFKLSDARDRLKLTDGLCIVEAITVTQALYDTIAEVL